MANSILDINEILNDYSIKIQESIQEDAIKVSKRGVDTLKTTSPHHIGKYARGWKVKTTKGRGYISCTIHNSTNWQLTHLLEKPHAIKNKYGSYGTSKPKVHIKPVEETCIREFERDVVNIIKNGG